MKKTFALVNTLALAITIAINYLSNTGMITGNTMKTISDRYANYFTPAGYAFSIWGVIYLGMLAFIIYGWQSVSQKNNQVLTNIGWWFVISCVANSIWVVVWLSDQLPISVALMALLFVSLLKINTNIASEQNKDLKTLVCLRWPFAIYFGWVTVASIANIAAFLTKIGWSGWGIPETTWTVIMLCVAGLVNLAVITKKRSYPFGLVAIWAVIAISVRNTGVNNVQPVIYACYAVAALITIFIAVGTFRRTAVSA